jgi:2',3'-cyclic-nucleotide 2'-phosphodiesterase (5'-nucleotidase family)
MSRRSKVNVALVVTLLVLALTMAMPAVAADGKLTIVHVNDVHGHIEPFTRSGAKEEVGALAKMAVYVEGLRKENANILLLSAGDMIHGTNVVNLFGGLPMVEIMNHMGFDAMALGNHEFNYGQEQLIKLAQAAKFPFLSANVVRDDGAVFIDDCAIFNIGGVKVGVFGLSPIETPILTHPKDVIGLKFVDPAEISAKMVDTLAGQADIIVCLSHLGYDADKDLAAAVPGIDIIVGGHSHTTLVEPAVVGDAIIVQTGDWAEHVGVLNVEVAGGKVASFDGGLVQMTADAPAPAADSPVGAALAAYKNALADKMAVEVGRTEVPLDGERAHVRTGTTNLANLICDAMLEATGADVVIANGGGIRASIKAGDITLGDIYTVLPFDNTLFAIELTGDRIVAALEHGLSAYPAQTGGFSHVAGMTVKFDPEKPAGSRVVEVLVAGQPIVADKLYILGTNDFLAAGGDGYVWFTESNPVFSSGAMLRDILAEYIEARGTVVAPAEIRIQIVK